MLKTKASELLFGAMTIANPICSQLVITTPNIKALRKFESRVFNTVK